MGDSWRKPPGVIKAPQKIHENPSRSMKINENPAHGCFLRGD
jgi:hypothetical protein